MSINISDIDVFVLSYNREDFIINTLRSILSQSICPNIITVFDNGSTDSTIEQINKLGEKRIKIIKASSNNSVMWNYKRAINSAISKYTILFHDDDIIHYQYLEHVLVTLNKFDNIGLVCSGMHPSKKPESIKMKRLIYKYNLFKDDVGLASKAYYGFPINFSSSVYRTDLLKTSKFENEKFQKISDRPFLFDIAKKGGSVLLTGKYIFYRKHQGQDSNNIKSGPYENHLIELHKKYYSILKDGGSMDRFIFYSNLKYYLKVESAKLKIDDFSFYELKTFRKLNLNKSEVFIIHILYFFRIYLLIKVYRYLLRLFHT